jgi:hypothetical protein
MVTDAVVDLVVSNCTDAGGAPDRTLIVGVHPTVELEFPLDVKPTRPAVEDGGR